LSLGWDGRNSNSRFWQGSLQLFSIAAPFDNPAPPTKLAILDPVPKPAISAAHPWKGDKPPHLPCRRGELPSAVFFPGDPGRVDRFANILSGFRILGQNREFRIGVGNFQGVELGVCSTGIGGPSTEIALVEAAELGCKFALRVGGAGALDPSIPLGSLIFASDALRGSGAASYYAPPDQPAKAHSLMIAALTRSANLFRLPHRTALVASTDSYYAGQDRHFPGSGPHPDSILQHYLSLGVAALDMEAETILVLGERLGMIAGVLLAVHGNRSTDQWLDDFSAAQEEMIRVGCNALARLVTEATPLK
jgi:uridine phosphorylase